MPPAWRRCASVGTLGLGPGRDPPHVHALLCQPYSQGPWGLHQSLDPHTGHQGLGLLRACPPPAAWT